MPFNDCISIDAPNIVMYRHAYSFVMEDYEEIFTDIFFIDIENTLNNIFFKEKLNKRFDDIFIISCLASVVKIIEQKTLPILKDDIFIRNRYFYR